MNMNLPNAITVGRILAAPFIAALPFIGGPGARLVAFVLFIVAAVTDYVRRPSRAHAQPHHRSRPAARSARRQAAARRDAHSDVRADGAADRSAGADPGGEHRCRRAPVRHAVREGRTSVVDRRDRDRARGLHDHLPPGRGPARRGHLRDRSGQVEDRLPVDVGRRGLLLVLRRDACPRSRLGGRRRLGRVRELQRHRRHGDDDRGGRSSPSTRSFSISGAYAGVFAL